MAEKKSKLDGGVPVGPAQCYTTPGNIITTIQGLSNDAGAGEPPKGGAYGAIADDVFPTGSKMPGGNMKAITSFFGTKNPGGGK